MGFTFSASPFFSVIVFFFLSVISFRVSESAVLAPAIYAFGDSLIDAGNNNHLKLSLAKANFPHNGIDFPTRKPTGRFSNGKNAADYLAEKVGLPTSPPYLSLVSKISRDINTTSFLTGFSFASGGAGIFNETNNLFKQSVAMSQQIDYYSKVYQQLVEGLGSSAAQAHLSKSLFAVVIGSNDIFGYYDESTDFGSKTTPQQYVDLMASTLESQLKRLYSYGGRKYVIAGVGLLGCTPSQRKKNKTGDCNAEVNYWASQYNIGLKSMLQRLKTQLNGFLYSYFDAFAVMSDYVHTPSSYGFVEIKAACCGLGNLNADVPCIPISSLCSNRRGHLFWDLYHPTQDAHRIFADYIFDGPLKYTYPLNVKNLVAQKVARSRRKYVLKEMAEITVVNIKPQQLVHCILV